MSKWRIILLGLVISQAASLTAMNHSQEKTTESSYNLPLSCSAEFRIKSAALKISTEKSKQFSSGRFYGYGRGRRNSPEAPYCYECAEMEHFGLNCP